MEVQTATGLLGWEASSVEKVIGPADQLHNSQAKDGRGCWEGGTVNVVMEQK